MEETNKSECSNKQSSSLIMETMVTADKVIKNVEIQLLNDSSPLKDNISTLHANAEVLAKPNKSNQLAAEFRGQTKYVTTSSCDLSNSEQTTVITTAPSVIEMSKSVSEYSNQTSSASGFTFFNFNADLSGTRPYTSSEMQTEKIPLVRNQDSNCTSEQGQETFKRVQQTKEYQLNLVQSPEKFAHDLKYKDCIQHGHIPPQKALQSNQDKEKVKSLQKPKEFLIRRHEQEILVKLLDQGQSTDHVDKRMRQDKVPTEEFFSEGFKKPGNYQNLTTNFHQFRPPNSQSTGFQPDYINRMNLQSTVSKGNVLLQRSETYDTIPKSLENMNLEHSSIKNYIYVIPLLDRENLEPAKLNTLKEIGVTLNIPFEQITSLGLPTKKKSGNNPLLNFPHDAVVEIDTDKIFSIVSS